MNTQKRAETLSSNIELVTATHLTWLLKIDYELLPPSAREPADSAFMVLGNQEPRIILNQGSQFV